MRISAINYQTPPQYFAGENKTGNKLKNAAGAAAIALAAAVPPAEADAQIYYTPPVYPYAYYVPTPTITTVPKCFVVGDMRNQTEDKSMRQVFDEIDDNGNGNGVISAKEVVRTERNNWNLNNLTPYTGTQMHNAEKNFNALSKAYNEDDSDPYTLNYNEYKAIMNDYMESSDADNLLDLMELLILQNMLTPPPPPPPIHHHHHYRPAPPPRHNPPPPPHRHDHRHW